MSDTASKLIEFSNNKPTFKSIEDNSLVYAKDTTFKPLALPTSKNTDNQYVLKINNDGNFYFETFTVTADMEVTQAPNQFILTGTDNTKLAANGIIVATDNGAKAYTVDLNTTDVMALKYNTTLKRIVTHQIYQAPKDWIDSSKNKLNKDGLILSENNGDYAKILEVPSTSLYGITKTSEGNIMFQQINNHSHAYYKLLVSKYQTTSDTQEDTCYLDIASKPYYVINDSGTGTTQNSIARGNYYVNIEIDLVPYDLNLLQDNVFTFKFGIGSDYSEAITIDQKMSNRVNLNISTFFNQAADGVFQILIGNASIPKCYKWDKIKLSMIRISN